MSGFEFVLALCVLALLPCIGCAVEAAWRRKERR